MANEKITNIVEEIKTLTILELADLVKAVEEEFGVSAAPVAVAGAAVVASSLAEQPAIIIITAIVSAISAEIFLFIFPPLYLYI